MQVDQFWEQNDPAKENLCLYGYADGTWEVTLPCEEVPPELPEPTLGINFARDGALRCAVLCCRLALFCAVLSTGGQQWCQDAACRAATAVGDCLHQVSQPFGCGGGQQCGAELADIACAIHRSRHRL